MQDLAELRAYLKGEVEESARVDYTAPELFEDAAAAAAPEAGPRGDRGAEGPLTLAGVWEEGQQMADRNSMLLCPGGKTFDKVLKVVQDQSTRLAARTKQRQDRENLESQRQRERKAKMEMRLQGSDRFNRDRGTGGAAGGGAGAERRGGRPPGGGPPAAPPRPPRPPLPPCPGPG